MQQPRTIRNTETSRSHSMGTGYDVSHAGSSYGSGSGHGSGYGTGHRGNRYYNPSYFPLQPWGRAGSVSSRSVGRLHWRRRQRAQQQWLPRRRRRRSRRKGPAQRATLAAVVNFTHSASESSSKSTVYPIFFRIKMCYVFNFMLRVIFLSTIRVPCTYI